MTTFDHLCAMLREIPHYAPGNPDRQWRERAADRYATMIAARLDEERSPADVMADAMRAIEEEREAA